MVERVSHLALDGVEAVARADCAGGDRCGIVARCVERGYRRKASIAGVTEKIWTLDEIVRQRAAWRDAGQRVVFTNGAFDLLHVGHVRYLQAARALGDLLIVGLNDDASVRGYKGPDRPLVPADERAELLAALACVDVVVLFGDPTATRLVAAIRPDIYVKGGDYAADATAGAGKPLPEAEAARAAGGTVVIVPFVPGRSTSGLIARIQAQARPAAGREGGASRARLPERGEAAD